MTQVEPYEAATVARKLPELLSPRGYWIDSTDKSTGALVTMPLFSWTERGPYNPWRHLVHPGVVVAIMVTPVGRWSSVTVEVRVLCETGQGRPNENVAEPSPESAVLHETMSEIDHLVFGYFYKAPGEVRGTSCAPLADGDRKVRICRDIARRNPQDGEAQLQYALSLINFFRPNEAQAPLERALALLGGRSDAYDTVVAALRASRAPAQVMRVYRRAVEALPEEPKWHMRLGLALADSSRYREALNHFERAAALTTADPDPPYAAAWTLYLLKRPDEAAGHCRSALPRLEARLPERAADAAAWVALAFCAAMLGRHEQAVAYFERAVRIAPGAVTGSPELLEVARRSLDVAGPQDPAPVPEKPPPTAP